MHLKKEILFERSLHNTYASIRFLWKNQSMQPGATKIRGKQLPWSQESQNHVADWCCDDALVRFKSDPSQNGDAMLYRITDSELEGTQEYHRVQLLRE